MRLFDSDSCPSVDPRTASKTLCRGRHRRQHFHRRQEMNIAWVELLADVNDSTLATSSCGHLLLSSDLSCC